MTVAELKKILENVDDSAAVEIEVKEIEYFTNSFFIYDACAVRKEDKKFIIQTY